MLTSGKKGDMLSDVLITLTSRQVDATGDVGEISFDTLGKSSEKAGRHYITYKESALTGMEGTTTLFKIEPGRVSVVRTGSIEAKQVFVAGEKYAFPYITAFGTFEMAVIPWVVEACLQEGEGRINLEYDLEIDGRSVSRNSLAITVKRRD